MSNRAFGSVNGTYQILMLQFQEKDSATANRFSHSSGNAQDGVS